MPDKNDITMDQAETEGNKIPKNLNSMITNILENKGTYGSIDKKN